jgi:hypothetical protein
MQNKNIDEGIFDWFTDRYQGLKGAFTGKGYGYFKFLSSLRNLVRKLKKLDEPNESVMNDLQKLRVSIEQATGWESLEDEKRKNLTFAIDKAIESFREYSKYVNTIEVLSTKVLQGKPTNTTSTQTNQNPPTQPTQTQTTTSPSVIPEGYRNEKRILREVENIKNLMR